MFKAVPSQVLCNGFSNLTLVNSSVIENNFMHILKVRVVVNVVLLTSFLMTLCANLSVSVCVCIGNICEEIS